MRSTVLIIFVCVTTLSGVFANQRLWTPDLAPKRNQLDHGHLRGIGEQMDYRPVEAFQPMSLSHINGFNVVLGVPGIESAYLTSNGIRFNVDAVLDYATIKTSGEENSIAGPQILNVDTTIQRILLGATLPWESLIKSAYPLDFRIGLPLIRWAERPSYTINNGKTLLLDGTAGSFGVGDLFFDLKHGLYRSSKRAFALHTRLKLPTGSKGDLTGSGNPDLSLGALYSGQGFSTRWNLNLGVIIPMDSKNILNSPTVDVKNIFYWGADWTYRWKSNTYVTFNFEGNQNAFEGYTGMDFLNDNPMAVGVGLSKDYITYNLYFNVKIGLSEASADQQISIGYKKNFYIQQIVKGDL